MNTKSAEGYKIARALLSVSDKTNIVEFARGLSKHKIQILSTGGTAKVLKAAGLAITDVTAYTEFPEIMDGRVKTLHPKIYGGILADRGNEKHMLSMQSHAILPVDMVVVNLYPFADVATSDASFDTCIENIDIGGISMIRSAAKNYTYVTVLTDPNQYQQVLEEIDSTQGRTKLTTRSALALKAFYHTAQYDAKIATWLGQDVKQNTPDHMCVIGRLKQPLRYGENPHQSAALYITDNKKIGVCTANQIQGKALSYNNVNDANTAFEIACEHSEPACAIIKHANPCGVAIAVDDTMAFKKALACDTVSAFGSVVAFNCTVSLATIKEIGGMFIESIVAPHFEKEALRALQHYPNIRVMETKGVPSATEDTLEGKFIPGGVLIQCRDKTNITRKELTVVTKRQPTEQELTDLLFANKVVKHAKSNAIVYARNGQTVGIGLGQTSRVESAKLGAQKSIHFLGTKDCVVASDAFFPFEDGLDVCIKAGATAIIQPGGSKNDGIIIEAADKVNISMVFTNARTFKH